MRERKKAWDKKARRVLKKGLNGSLFSRPKAAEGLGRGQRPRCRGSYGVWTNLEAEPPLLPFRPHCLGLGPYTSR